MQGSEKVDDVYGYEKKDEESGPVKPLSLKENEATWKLHKTDY